MNLPNVLNQLVKAQNNFDSAAYADCFSEKAIVFDEGRTHTGKAAIEIWIDKANKEYQAVMNPIEYSASEQTLKVEASGTFAGSPIIMTYHFEFDNELIESLRIV